MKIKSEFNIDYLKLCYRQPEGLFQEIASTQGELVYRLNTEAVIEKTGNHHRAGEGRGNQIENV